MGDAALFLCFLWLGWRSLHDSWKDAPKLITAARLHFVENRRSYLLAAPFIFVVLLFSLFAYFINPGEDLVPKTIGERGTFGDSFGVLNSLFSGLGFAGLTLTLWMQQKQIESQAFESKKLDEARQIDRYEATIHRLLDLYRKCVDEVSEPAAGRAIQGRSALTSTTQDMLRMLEDKTEDVEVPPEVVERYRNGELTETDGLLLDEAFFNITSIINIELVQHRSLTDTFTLLLRHLVDDPPTFLGLEPYLLLVQSQITPSELSYFFYLALGFEEEDELRRLLAGTHLILTTVKAAKVPQIHQLLYLRLWGEDPKAIYCGEVPHRPFA